MAKMTLANVKTLATEYVLSASQAKTRAEYETWIQNNPEVISGMIKKIGLQIMFDGQFIDKLSFMDGWELGYGPNIEEYYIDLSQPLTREPVGQETRDPNAPHDPTFEAPSYSVELGDKPFATTIRYAEYEKAMLGASETGELVGRVTKRLSDSIETWKYGAKRQLLANLIAKAEAKGGDLVTTLATPVDESTSEAFLEQVKKDVEIASDISEGHSLNGSAIGASEGLTLIVKQGIVPTLDVKTLAGAFHMDKVALPSNVVVVPDFGDDATGAYAMLIDTRGIKLAKNNDYTLTNVNGDGGFYNVFRHVNFTGFISKNTFVKVYKGA